MNFNTEPTAAFWLGIIAKENRKSRGARLSVDRYRAPPHPDPERNNCGISLVEITDRIRQ
ncbi:MAG: hypothetical protein Q8L79_13925 [Methylobacter sp.]|uniref:hypothetical protein n=1 Tax=Methylobacter sp. TaxID=2051955 RepID=UPI0027309A9C|nr:hypothetical protein [Methylobacter sp.]MDP1666205.1 hypothetical protein [Methylobacter sp.]